MKYVDEFRDPEMAKTLLKEIEALTLEIPKASKRPLHIMEVCGGHTHSIFKFGIETMLPDCIELVHGPGSCFLSCKNGYRPDKVSSLFSDILSSSLEIF
jgi:hydrogenase expression/formation protein HypD